MQCHHRRFSEQWQVLSTLGPASSFLAPSDYSNPTIIIGYERFKKTVQ